MIKTSPLSVKTIEKIAKEVRESFNIKLDEAFPILDYLNHLFYKGELGIQIIDDDDLYLDKKTVALYNASDNFIYLKESVIEEVDNGIYRSNFTLAHELFHYIQAQIFKFDFYEVETRKAYEDPEWQANEFAGELLLPKAFLVDDDIDFLASHFKVSKECVLTRKVKKKRREEKNSNND